MKNEKKDLDEEVIKVKECDFYQLSLVIGWSTDVAVGVQEHLGVGMDGDEGLEVTVGPHKVNNGLDLRLRVSLGSMVNLGAGVIAGTRSYKKGDNSFRETAKISIDMPPSINTL